MIPARGAPHMGNHPCCWYSLRCIESGLVMIKQQSQPSLSELYELAGQLERDHDASLHALRQRDHEIGARCNAGDDPGRLRFWLREVTGGEPSTTGDGAALLLRLLALALGFSAMAGFLLASGRGLVNVFLFLGLFVFLQLFFSLLGAVVMLRSLRGVAPPVSVFNPVRLLLDRLFPDASRLRPSSAVLRLFALRCSQESGLLFTLGALAAYLVLLAFSDFTFVWGSTFAISDQFVSGFTGIMALPWSSWFAAAVASPELIASSRFHPAITDLAMADLVALRAWWPFLLMSLLVYGLAPRLLLWWLSRRAFRRELLRAFSSYPGAAAVLTRMRAPLVRTQAQEPEDAENGALLSLSPGADALLLDWADALSAADSISVGQLAALPAEQRLRAGSGAPEDDLAVLAQIRERQPQQLLLLVRSWEPPMADLKDLLQEMAGLPACTLCLAPLPGRSVSDANLGEWRGFAAGLASPPVHVVPLRAA